MNKIAPPPVPRNPAGPAQAPDAASPPSCGGATLKLAAADLERSGLSLERALADGIFPVDDASAYCPDFAPKPALIIPYYDARGRPLSYVRGGQTVSFCRARYLAPPGWPLPKGRKYDQPADSGTPPYFPPTYNWTALARGDPEACVLVEGEKKAVALCRAGIPAVAIGGVYNFADGSVPLHPQLASIAGGCADVFIVFDSDASEKPQIQAAEQRLAGQLALAGTTVHVVRLPPDGTGKVGADDYLAAHGREALEALIVSTPALGEAEGADSESTLNELLGREVSPVEELIPGWLEKGIPTFLAGPGGVHKSRLALQIGLCLNAGASVFGLGASVEGLHPGRQVTLVYCSAEDDENELARRTQAISKALKLKAPKPTRGVFLARNGQDSALVVMDENGDAEPRPFFHQLMRRLQSIAGHKLVVLDSAYDFVRFAGRAKISEDAVNRFIKGVLQELCDQTDSTILVPWHPSQAGSERTAMDGWSVAWHNSPRARWGLSEAKDLDDCYELRVLKRNHGRKAEPITLRFHEGALLPLDAVPDNGKAAALRKVCVRLAIEAARLNVPFNKRDRVADLVLRDVEREGGRRPSQQEFKNALEEATRAGLLQYVGYSRHRAAGFYPADMAEAHDLAHAAKRASRSDENA